MNSSAVFMGVDVGTQGVRVVAMSENGVLLASAHRGFSLTPSLRQEQPPELWNQHILSSLAEVSGHLKNAGMLHRVVAVSATSTSGTVIPLDSRNHPLSPAIMYSDDRSEVQAQRCREAAAASRFTAYSDFHTSSGLPKVLWFVDTQPAMARRIALWAHATDYVIGLLSGIWGISDYSSVLKTGYDLDSMRWPDFVSKDLNVPANWLPKVVAPGTVVGSLSESVASLTGLPKTAAVVAGMTDGCASQLAAGAVALGDWSTTIGTTLVIKGVTQEKIVDPGSGVYNHRHPKGYWMPGGASNTGADWVAVDYATEDLKVLSQAAERFIPTGLAAWPLLQKGERFPFVSAKARGFDAPTSSRELRFASRLEGVAYIERMAFEKITQLTHRHLQHVFTAGGGSNNLTWLRIRSSVLGVPVVKMRHTQAAAGAALLAASTTWFPDLEQAARHMLQKELQIEPDFNMSQAHEYEYGRFVAELKRRGFTQ